MTRQQQVLQVLRQRPGLSLRGVCHALRPRYTWDGPERRKVRSVLQALERKGLARRDTLGRWWAV